MQSDQLIWDTIAESFCSFKVKTVTQSFCRNEYNVTGLCDRESCPLANSRYATIKEKEGVLYLCVKTIERAHTPKRMWEKIKLSKNFTKALAQIDEELIFWPEQMILKCKQRMTKIKQYLVRMRRLRSKTTPKLVSVKKKIDRREARREQKAEQAARLEMSIEKELLNRLRQGVYGSDGIVNESQEAFAEALDEIEEMYEQDQDLEDEELDREFVSDISDDEDDIEDGPSFQFSDEDSLDDEDEKPKKKSIKIDTRISCASRIRTRERNQCRLINPISICQFVAVL
ncbi:Mak16 protein [Gorgonomyces haynaldii]|nr:Mak16 protein [Gorgonomyces haynaldii]